MASAAELIKSDYVHRGVEYSPPNGRQLIIVPADRSNYSMPGDGRYRGTRQYLGAVIHTPEEPADDNEVTPKWFKNPKANASTDAYTDSDGDLYAMVPSIGTAWAQGTRKTKWFTKKNGKKIWHKPNDRFVVEGKPYPDWFPRLNGVVLSYNQFLASNEVEGYAVKMKDTFNPEGNQFDTLASWLGWQMFVHGWSGLDRVLSHQQLCTWKTDPGSFVVDLFPKIYNKALEFKQEYESKASGNSLQLTPESDTISSLQEQFANLQAQVNRHESTLQEVRKVWTNGQ